MRYRLLTASVSAIGIASFLAAAAGAQTAPATAAAQDAAPDNPQDINAQDIVVTGSRVALSGFQAPSPTAVVGSEVIDRRAATTVMSVLNLNPAFKPTRSPGANATNTGSPAQATADLRSLGGQRTLVLVNGSRMVPSSPASKLGVPVTVDLNLIPTLMVDRVETVTGGASAQYGSDAVSGVVNVILKKHFTGLEARAQAGISEEGDYATQRLGFIAGTSFAQDRGHVVVSADYERNSGVGDMYTRDWGRKEYQIYSNSAYRTNGQPALILTQGVHNNLGAGGRITGPAGFSLNKYTFNSDGSVRPFDSGTLSNGTTQIGGEGQSIARGTSLVPALRRFTTYAHAEYEFGPALTAYVEGGYSRSKGILSGLPPRYTSVTIKDDNAYLSPAVKAAMAKDGITSFTMSRIGYDFGNVKTEAVNATRHVEVGGKGELGGSWHWDAHYSYGRNNYDGYSFNNTISANVPLAADAVFNSAGKIVCRSTRDVNPNNGCVPLNLFGAGSPSAAAINYVNGTGHTTVKYIQHSAAANLRGNLFSTWAGPVSAAVGIEYRRESENVGADPIAAANGFSSTGNAVPYRGSFDVKEAYVEAIVPLAKDKPFLRSLNINGAARFAHYSTVGDQVTWKVGGVWEPVDGLRLRVTRSRDIRAPAIWELASPGNFVTNTITVNGITKIIPQNVSAGNPDLKAEKADTFTAGVVVEPGGFLRGLRASVDYYDINLKGAITNLSGLNVASLCTLGQQEFCSLFTFDAAGNPTSLTAPALNVGSFRNKGLDMTLSYGFPLGEGRVSIAASGTYVFNALVDPGTGAGAIERVGEMGQANLGAMPRFRGNLAVTYTRGPFSITPQLNFISAGKQDNIYNTTPALTINDNHVPAFAYLDLAGSIDATQQFRFFWSIENLLDKDPAPTPYAVLNVPTNGIWYDKVGRRFMAGVRVRL
ncbi:TonB-dependent receptor [Sphingobium sp. TA15]|uniref:TonB-dependent receptor-like protein n=1 Tax=Sphingobium indicum (strain DSM 16413 / CCM 7287 / MTCC 6362 / UT26 / NBRC 101211 / UT26S) TaxID=452662 RepID=D4YXG6_SPHIU|nr:TonB-dependent receptor [Sphingobium indicum]BAI95048.1 TonB-dependent receptor-like protein [Sphingobium indicum UT26S]BDD67927.1 TonB-dependent receptor [Sphingobium sp. TA15]